MVASLVLWMDVRVCEWSCFCALMVRFILTLMFLACHIQLSLLVVGANIDISTSTS